jgi:diguanylate cyclase (GGDEF)-like protein
LSGLAFLEGECIAFKPETMPLSVIVCDIDHFKSINDTFGHDAGDNVLRAFGSLLKDSVRAQDVGPPTGGEEFTILLAATGEDQAVEIAHRVRSRFKATAFVFGSGTRLVTASFGVAERRLGEPFFITAKKADDRRSSVITSGSASSRRSNWSMRSSRRKPGALRQGETQTRLTGRYAAAAVLMAIPPFGIVGWAHPITAAGVLFPGWGWAGFGVAAAGLIVMTTRWWPAAASALAGFWLWSAATWTSPGLPEGWRGVDLEQGKNLGRGTSLEQQRDLIATVKRAAGEGARFILLPESALGFWTPTVERL